MIVAIDMNRIDSWRTFHDVFAESFGFPGFYGRNMDAWIDCMTYLDVDTEMTKVYCARGEVVTLALRNVKLFKSRCPEIYDALIECSAFVNYRRIETGDPPVLVLSFHD